MVLLLLSFYELSYAKVQNIADSLINELNSEVEGKSFLLKIDSLNIELSITFSDISTFRETTLSVGSYSILKLFSVNFYNHSLSTYLIPQSKVFVVFNGVDTLTPKLEENVILPNERIQFPVFSRIIRKSMKQDFVLPSTVTISMIFIKGEVAYQAEVRFVNNSPTIIHLKELTPPTTLIDDSVSFSLFVVFVVGVLIYLSYRIF